MSEQLVSIVSVAVIGTSAYGLGRPVVRGLRLGDGDLLSVWAWSFTVGLILAGLLLAALGMMGWLYTPLIGVLSAVACFWGLGELLSDCVGRRNRTLAPVAHDSRCAANAQPAPFAPPATWLAVSMPVLASLACLGSLVGALAPPTDGDALCYHLELPKAMLASHSLEFLPDSDNSTFPLLVEMWYLWALALDGGVAAQLIHWGIGVVLGAATVVMATPIVGRPWARIAGALVLLVPSVSNQMTAPLNDAALTLLCTLSLAAWWRAAIDDESPRWFVLSGLCAGGALATKYLALLFFAALAVVTSWLAWRHRQRRQILLEGAAAVAIVAVSVGGVWYLRAAWYRGNPVYPFFCELFNGPLESPQTTGISRDPRGIAPIASEPLRESKLPLGRHPVSLLTSAWKVSMHPERYGGRGHRIGIVFLAVGPGLLLVRRLRGLEILIGIAGLYWVLWFLLRQNVRFLLPIVPILSVIAAWVLIELARLPCQSRRLVAAALGLALLASCLTAMVRCRDRWAVACGWETRDEYLARAEPTWQAACVSNALYREGDHILSQEHRAFYFKGRVTREHLYRRRTGYDRQIAEPLQFSRRLREAGFTHLLLAENRGEAGVDYDPTLSRLADAERAAGGGESLLILTDYTFPDSDGGLRRYRLILLE